MLNGFLNQKFFAIFKRFEQYFSFIVKNKVILTFNSTQHDVYVALVAKKNSLDAKKYDIDDKNTQHLVVFIIKSRTMQ